MAKPAKRFFRARRPVGGKRKLKSGVKRFVFFAFCALTAAAAYTAASLDARLLPPVLAVVEKTAKNRVNASIDHSLRKITDENALETSDFLVKTTDAQGMVNSLSVNTLLVNDLCGRLAADIGKELESSGRETVRIPLATITGLRAFANAGPALPITVLPVGGAVVDYESAFESVGINQVNFRLWLRVDAAVRVVNPVQNQDILVSRKVALVNTVFSGQVPDTYLNNTPVVPLPLTGEP